MIFFSKLISQTLRLHLWERFLKLCRLILVYSNMILADWIEPLWGLKFYIVINGEKSNKITFQKLFR